MKTIDPLHAYSAGVRTSHGTPMPLVSTDVSVVLEGGLAIVAFKRAFRNVEKGSIEATLTFPVPVDSVMTGLVVRVGDRVLSGSAQPREKARTQYEEAMDAGKSAVLHEEVLKGVHVLTVGHIPPGTTVEVESRWVQPLSFVGEAPSLSIPTTTGHIYGRSPLQPVDDILIDDVTHKARLSIVAEGATPHVMERRLVDGKCDIELDRSIEIVLTGWKARTAMGSLDGKKVAIDVDRMAKHDNQVDLVVIADRSGSMNDTLHRLDRPASKFESMKKGLHAVASELGDEDGFELWQFASGFSCLGTGKGSASAAAILAKLQSPSGSTEIGMVLSEAISRNPKGNILLITDGRSHALDVLALSKGEHRITVLLIGEEALEAHVGHLAALTGGQIFVAGSGDIVPALQAAISSMRAPFRRPQELQSLPDRHEETRRGARILLSMQGEGVGTDDIGAFAAGLLLPALPEADATNLAVSAGIVSHLTSLVLVDEAGEAQEGLASMRKIPLSTPRSAMRSYSAPSDGMAMLSASHAMSFASATMRSFTPREVPPAFDDDIGKILTGMESFPTSRTRSEWSSAPVVVDWAVHAGDLLAGDLSSLSLSALAAIKAIAADEAVIAYAKQHGFKAEVVALAVVASISTDRHAERFLRKAISQESDKALLQGMAKRLTVVA